MVCRVGNFELPYHAKALLTTSVHGPTAVDGEIMVNIIYIILYIIN